MTPPLSLRCAPLLADAALALGGTYPTFMRFFPEGAAEKPRRAGYAPGPGPARLGD